MHRWQADSALVLITLIWGTTFVVVKNSLSFVGPLVFLAARFSIAALVLLLAMVLRRERMTRHLFQEGVIVGCFLTLGFVTQTIGLQTTESGKAAFITGLSVVLVPIIAAWLLHKPSTKGAVAGVLLATVGLGLMTLNRRLQFASGDFWLLACAIGFALHIIAVAQFSSKHALLPFTWVQLFTVAVLTSIAALFFESDALFPPAQVLPSILYMAIVATAFVFGVQSWGQRYTTPTHTAIIFSLEPVFAAVTAALFANEFLEPKEWVGGGLILVGMLFAELGDLLLERGTTEAVLEKPL